MGWIQLLMLIGVIAAPVAVIVAVFRARRAEAGGPVVRIALIISAIWAGMALLRAVVTAIFWFMPNTYPYFALRTQPYWPAAHATWDGTGVEPAELVTGGFTTAQASASGLSTTTRTILASGDIVGGCVTAALAGLVAWMCFRLLQGRPFAGELARVSLIAAGVCLVGGVTAQLLWQTGGSAATAELIQSGTAPAGLAVDSGISLDFWPVWTAIGLGAFAALLRYGTALQRDAEGLV